MHKAGFCFISPSGTEQLQIDFCFISPSGTEQLQIAQTRTVEQSRPARAIEEQQHIKQGKKHET